LLTVTFAALPATAVLAPVVVAPDAGVFASPMLASRLGPSRVLAGGDELQVVDVHALSVETQVIDGQVSGDGPPESFVNQAVGVEDATADPTPRVLAVAAPCLDALCHQDVILMGPM
jgi:hypothetical protein